MFRFALTAAVVSAFAGSAGAQTLFGPNPYLSFADSPFSGLSFNAFQLEDFEDGAFNTPGATPSAGWVAINGGQSGDSVDADDGAIDGSGAFRQSYYSAQSQRSLTVTFDAVTFGQFPTHAGLVWTDVGAVDSGLDGFASVTFEGFGPGGVALGSVIAFPLGDGSVTGGTAEDRFFGFESLSGIESIRISVPSSADWEVDHIQYGVVPSPAVGMVFAGLACWPGARRRR